MLYSFLCRLSKLYFKLFYRVSLQGVENVPKQGAIIICSNHISLLDMFLFGPHIYPRKIHFMAKQELFKIPLLSGILNALGAFPVNRGKGDLNSAKTTLKLLNEGKAVGIFPEGTRSNKSKKKVKPKYGAILFALESGAPIVPVGIFSNYRLFSRLKVVFGKPIYLPYETGEKVAKEEMQKMVEELMEKIYSLDSGSN